MNIFNILSESRGSYTPRVQQRIIKPMRIVVEAEDDNTKEEKLSDADDNETNIKSDNDDKDEKKPDNNEEKQDKEKESNDTGEEDDNDIDGTDDDVSSVDNDPDSGSMDMSDTDNPDDSGESEESTDIETQIDETDPDKTKSLALLDDTITLYYSIKRIIDKISNVSSDTIETLKSFDHAKENFVNLSELLYVFITQRFNTNTYVKNLYIFNYFIQTYKLNIDILEKTLKIKVQ